MRLILMVLLLGVPTLGLSQTLGDVAKKERERRERNKKEGKKALIFSEVEIFGEPEENEGAEGDTTTDSSGSTAYENSSSGIDLSEEGPVPTSIPPDLPMDTRMALFQRMKAHYESQVRELDEQIQKNATRISELDAEIRTASSSGGAGLPVAPSVESANQQFTGQESETLLAEQSKLRTLNEQLEARKGELKANVVAQGRVGGIPAGYLRF